MIRNQAYMDGVDISTYGVSIPRGGYNDLLRFSAIKNPYTNDWAEINGVEVDLSEIYLKSKEVNIPFVDETGGGYDLIRAATAIGYHELQVPMLGRSWSLRMLDEDNRIAYRAGQSFSLNFIDDFPKAGLSDDAAPVGHGISALPKSLYAFDGVRFDAYGVVVEKGKAEVLKTPALKGNLARDISIKDGIIYDAGRSKFKSKDVVLACCFLTDTMVNFWKNYDAFFGAMTKPVAMGSAHYLSYAGNSYACFYKDSSDFKLANTKGLVAVKFKLSLVFTEFTK